MSDKSVNAVGTPLECRFRLATVCILSVPYHLDRPFDYLIPNDLNICIGDFVAVPFGGGNRPETALVVKISSIVDNTDSEMKYKPISQKLSDMLSLNAEAIAMVEFLKERTFCTTGEAVRTITPAAAFSKLNEYVKCIAPLPEYYGDETLESKLYDLVKNTENCTKSKLTEHFSSRQVTKLLNTLIDAKVIEVEIGVKDASNVKYTICYTTDLTDDQITSIIESKKLRSDAHINILKYLSEYGKCSQDELCDTLNISTSQLKTLALKGLIKADQIEKYRIPYNQNKTQLSVNLTEYQQNAVNTITDLIKSGEPKAALLYGVTGSGKTQVMRAAIEHVISLGKSAILLVPEISLTPQTIAFFSSSFGERTAVIHSGLSAGERYDAWRRIKKGEIDVCIGTRSAIFAPFDNLGLIVIDEEQEHTYKSDSSPKYNSKDIAAFRCSKNNCTMLLASATPSIESYYKAVTGVYTLCELPSRFGNGGIPKTDIVDMRVEAKDGNFSLFSERLVNALAENLENKKQSVLFLNRRGYHSFMSCPSCGEVFMCPHCSVSLTHHFSKFNSGGYLLCHYCGYKERIPEKCPKCENDKMRFMGYGTQLAQEQLQKIFPNARILRMDADTTVGKFAYDDIIDKFRSEKANILLGTQMVTKGHDFPNVTLVGILCADQSLYVDDYRANERTFSLICQTVGRAGRRDEEGNALVQCYCSDHPVIDVASRQDYKEFYKNEIALRKAFSFPPFCDIATITVTSDNEGAAFSASQKFLDELKSKLLSSYTDVKMQIFGPFEAPVYKVNEKFRVRLVIKFKNSKKSRTLFRETISFFGKNMPKTVSIGIDINPTTL